MKHQKREKNAPHNLVSNVLFYPNNNSQPKDIQFTLLQNDESIFKIAANYILVDQLIN